MQRNESDIPLEGFEEAMYQRAVQLCGQRKFDVIFASSLPQCMHRIAYRLSRKFRIPWVADHRDIIGQNGSMSFDKHRARSLSRKMTLPLEYCATILRDTKYDRRACAITTVSEGLAEKLRKRTMRSVDVVMNGFDQEDYCDIPRTDENERFTIAYTGSLWGDGDPSVFFQGIAAVLDALPEAAENMRIDFYGPCCGTLAKMMKAGELPALAGIVRLMGTVSAEDAKKAQCSADALYLVSHPVKGIATGKIFEYLAAGKAIISVPGDGDITDTIIRKSGVGYIAGTAGAVCDTIIKMYTEWKDHGRLTLAPNREYILQFSRKREAGQLSGILDRASCGR